MHQVELVVETRGRGSYEISHEIDAAARAAGVERGLCHVFIAHTSASLLITENADPDVRRDLETFLATLAPDGDPRWRHRAEGPDDMPAHLRSAVTQTALTVPVRGGRLALGTWQGIYVLEHRLGAQRRRILVTVQG